MPSTYSTQAFLPMKSDKGISPFGHSFPRQRVIGIVTGRLAQAPSSSATLPYACTTGGILALKTRARTRLYSVLPSCRAPPPTVRGRTVYMWSDPTAWPKGTVPSLGENVTIEADKHIIIDLDPPELEGITVYGGLECLSNGTDVVLRAEWILVRGKGHFTCGEVDSPVNGTFTVALSGDRYTNGIRFGGNNYGSKLLLALGTVDMHGRVPSPAWTRLNATVEVGAAEILLETVVDWRAGDEIVIASTS